MSSKLNFRLAPSILSANFSRLETEIKNISEYADWLHIDVMDGHFVPNISIGPPVVKSLREVTELFFDVHLMIDNPENFIEPFAKAGADLICVHAEATRHLHRLLQTIREFDCKVGVALNPASGLEMIEPILEDLDLVLLMTVNPGFGGQSFIESVLPKIRALRKKIDERELPVDLEVDGGISSQTLPAAIEAGANVFVAGSAIFSQPSPLRAITEIKDIIEKKGAIYNAV